MGNAVDTCNSESAKVRQRGVELVDEYEYIDHAGHRQRRKATLDKAALHDTQLESLRRARTDDLLMQGEQESLIATVLRGCNFGDLAVPPPVVDRAHQVVEQARAMMREVAKEPSDVLDKDWLGPAGRDPLASLLEEADPRLQAQLIVMLARAAERRLASDAMLVEAQAPARIFGDIHGQFRDVLLLLHDFGFTDDQSGTTYVFNGDRVDRGRHQLEVIVLLFALKVVYPSRIVLVRGNHEDMEMNRFMGPTGFADSCVQRLGEPGYPVFATIAGVFDWLPMACLLEGHILIVHGGIGNGDWDLDYLYGVRRPLTHGRLAADQVLWNILWSDPIPDEAENNFGVHASPRDNHANIISTWGKDVTRDFCLRNDLDMVVRSHQALKGGCGYEAMHTGRCVRVFSARDYEGNDNDASVLLVTREQSSGQLVIRPQVLRSLAKVQRDAHAAAEAKQAELDGRGGWPLNVPFGGSLITQRKRSAQETIASPRQKEAAKEVASWRQAALAAHAHQVVA